MCFYPVHESLGAALLVAGRTEDAERVFRDDLVKHPRNLPVAGSGCRLRSKSNARLVLGACAK